MLSKQAGNRCRRLIAFTSLVQHLVGSAGGARRQVGVLVGVQVAALREGQALKVNRMPPRHCCAIAIPSAA